MTWARLDDLYDDNRKIKQAWRQHPRAVGLHAMAVTYCARHETDGLVDLEWLEEKLPQIRERNQVLHVMGAIGLFEALDGRGWAVHDFLDYNPSRASTEAQRALKANRQRRWRNASTRPSTDASRDASVDASRAPARALTRPDPTRYPPDPPQAGGTRRRVYEQKKGEVEEARDAWIAEHFPDHDPTLVKNTAAYLQSNLRTVPTVDAVRARLDEGLDGPRVWRPGSETRLGPPNGDTP